MPGYSQDKRYGELKFPGEKELVLLRFSGTEGISEPFVFHVDALHETKGDIDLEKSIGKNVTVLVNSTKEGEKRWFDGLLTTMARSGEVESGFTYHLVLRPKLYLATKAFTSRIFHNKTVNVILNEVLTPYGPFYDKTERTYPEAEYVVQHRESDFAFASRLMEAHGISYHFKQLEGAHHLILADTGREPNEVGGGTRSFGYGAGQLRDEEVIFDWQKERTLTTGKVTTNDYYFEKPTAKLDEEKTGDAAYEPNRLEDYAQLYNQSLGKTTAANYGADYAKYRLHSHRSEDEHFSAGGDAPGLTPGYLMTLTNHDTDNGDYVIVRATHSLSVQGYRSGEQAGSSYSGTYSFYPNRPDKPYTPPMVTPRPVIGGIETAVVVSGEVGVDKYGRIEVQFHWNKPNAKDKSIRARVAQMWAGNQWGTVYWPRVGMEAVVTFVNGDPDRPLVIGTVYNKDNMPPFNLEEKDKENISGVKSRTVGGGGYNEFVLDDTSGKELVRMHAQKDHESLILNDEKREIRHDRVTTITNDETLTVDNNIMIEARTSLTLKVGMSTIKMDAGSITIESPMVTVHAKANLTTQGDAFASHSAGGPMTITAALVKIN